MSLFINWLPVKLEKIDNVWILKLYIKFNNLFGAKKYIFSKIIYNKSHNLLNTIR